MADPTWKESLTGVGIQEEAPVMSFPTLVWISGKPGMGGWRESGAFFISDDQGINVYGKDWKKTDYITPTGVAVPGFYNPTIVTTVIRVRRAWFVKIDGEDTRFAWDEYKRAKRFDSPRGKIQIVMAVDGLDGLVQLSVKGFLSAHAVERGGWGELARRYIYGPAVKVMKLPADTRLPSLCFKIKLGGGTGDKRYLTVGTGDKKSVITPIFLLEPTEPVTEKTIAPYVVTKLLREQYEQTYRDCDEWVNSWRVSGETAGDYGDPGPSGDLE